MVLELKNVCKKYNDFYAVKDFSMMLSEGIHGILGPNGAGKSTLMNMLTQNLKMTSGEIFLDGICFRKVGDKLPDNFRLLSDSISLEDVYLYYFEGDNLADK